MKLYSPGILTKINHVLWVEEDLNNFNSIHNRLEAVLNRRQIPGRGKLSIPYCWSNLVLHFVVNAIEVDRLITFVTIEERHGNLYVDFDCCHIIEEDEIKELLYTTRNKIDKLTHSRINRALKMRVTDDDV